MKAMNIGFGQGDITPKGKVAMIGLYSTRITQEVFTPLRAVAMAIASESADPVYWATCDLLYITDTLVDAVCRRLAEHLVGFHRSQLMLSATHIHTGPFVKRNLDSTLLSFTCTDPDVLSPEECCEQVADGIAQAILAAVADLEPALTARAASDIDTGYCRRVVFADGTAQMYGDVTSERYSHMECRDGGQTRLVYVYREQDHSLKGVIADVPCTAQVDVKTPYLHADFWHFTRAYVEERLHIPVFGICACAGDLSPRNMFEQDPPEKSVQMERLGVRVGEAIVNAAAAAVDTDEPVCAHAFRELSLPCWNPTPARYQSAKAICKQLYLHYGFRKGESPFHFKGFPTYLFSDAEVTVKRFQEQIDRVVTPVHALRIGNALFITNPFECFIDYGDRIKAALPELDILDVQLTDQYLGYLPTRIAVHSGGYSACIYNGACPPDGGDTLVEESIRILSQL